MSNPQQNTGCVKIVLIVVGVGLGFILLKFLYFASCYLAVNLFVGMDLSTYGRIGTGGWAGYALLGLGLGAAGGAIAAQRRFRLNKLVSLGAVALVLILCSFVFIGNTASSIAATELPDVSGASDKLESSSVVASDTILSNSVSDQAPSESNTQSNGPSLLLDNAPNLLEKTFLYIKQHDVKDATNIIPDTYGEFETGMLEDAANIVALHKLFKAEKWEGAELSDEQFANLMLRGLKRKPQATTNQTAVSLSGTNSVRDSAQYTSEEPDAEPTASSVTLPTGHRQHTGQIGKLAATYSLDWQSSGVLTGSYYYDKDPSTIYRLTGAATATGELRLVEFTRGRQSARCELKLQDGTYVGTMFNTDGRQFPMNLE